MQHLKLYIIRLCHGKKEQHYLCMYASRFNSFAQKRELNAEQVVASVARLFALIFTKSFITYAYITNKNVKKRYRKYAHVTTRHREMLADTYGSRRREFFSAMSARYCQGRITTLTVVFGTSPNTFVIVRPYKSGKVGKIASFACVHVL